MSVYQNTSMDAINSTVTLPSEYCRRFQDEEKFLTMNLSVTLASIILNVFSCPFVILINALVIVAVKTRHRLQSMSNILLASLAGTDLLMGTTTLPASIAAEIFAIAGGSVTTYCTFVNKIVSPLRFLSVLTSTFHLGVISVERYIALKYSLRYYPIVTKFRLTIAITFSWCLAGVYTLFKMLIITSLHSTVLQFLTVTCVLVIVYCHASVYIVTRRHERQIRTEQIPAGEDAERFLKEKKAWKTTGIIIGFVVLSLLPGFFVNFGLMFNWDPQWLNSFRPLVHSSLMLNSLCNPIIYCFRMKTMRQAMIALLQRQTDNNLT